MLAKAIAPLLCAALWVIPAGSELCAAEDAVVEITEWEVPWPASRPRDPWAGPDGRIWFVGQTGHYVATLDPDSGSFEQIDLEDGAGPHTVIVNEAGAWYAGNRVQHIGLIDPKTRSIERIPLPGGGARDPHTMDFTRQGDIWFTAQQANQVGFLDVERRSITLYDIDVPMARPYGLVVDGNDRPWLVLFGTNRLATVDPGSGEIEQIVLPREEARPRRIAVTGDGMVWYVDFARGFLGRYDPGSGAIDEWRVPGGEQAGPYAMGADHRGWLWFVETGRTPNRFVGFDPASSTFTEPVEIGSGGGVVRHMSFDRRSQAFWFGTDTNTIGRAVVR